MVSCFGKPEISAALLFHSVTMPFRSTRKMGAFALSNQTRQVLHHTILLRGNFTALCDVLASTNATSHLIIRATARGSIQQATAALAELVNMGNSKFAVSFPRSADASTSSTEV